MKKNQMMKFAMVMTLALATTAAFAQKTVTLQSGTTNVALSSAFLDALQSLNITPGVVYPTILAGPGGTTAPGVRRLTRASREVTGSQYV